MKQENKKIKILLVRFQRIGDAILASPLCNSLKKSFPNSQIDYVLYEPATPLFLHHPYIDKVICISKQEQKNIFAYIRRVWEITREKYDIVIDIMSTPKSELFTLFSLGSEYRIGRYKKSRGFTYTHKQKEPEQSENKIDKFLKQLLPPLEERFSIVYDSKLVLGLSKEEKQNMKEKMKEAGLDFQKAIVPFAVLSRVERKTYPMDFMKTLVSHCLQHYDMQVLFFYSPDQKEQIQQFASSFSEEEKKKIFSNIETKTMREAMALFANSTCYIGNEGGPRHMAQALGLPSFALFNPFAEKKEWLPYPNEQNVGFEPSDTLSFHRILEEEFEALSAEEKFKLLSPDFLIPHLDHFLSKVFSRKESLTETL